MSDDSSEAYREEPSVGDALRMLGDETKSATKRKAPKYPRRWSPGEDYELFRKGVVLDKSPDDIADKLGPGALFLFRHKKDSSGGDVVSFGEDKDRPLWYGVFKPRNYPEDVYYQPTQDQEKALYRTRTAKTMPKDFHIEDGTPYWVDSYYHKKGRERMNKKRHTSKINAKKRRNKLISTSSASGIAGTDEQAEIDEEIFVSGGLPIDSQMFHAPPEKLNKTLAKGNYFNERKVAKKTMVTGTVCKNLTNRAKAVVDAMFSSSLDINEDGEEEEEEGIGIGGGGKGKKGAAPPKKKKMKTAHQENMEKKWSSDFLARPFNKPPKLEHVPDIIIDFINEQFRYAKGGFVGMVSDAMYANFKDYGSSTIPTQRVMGNCTGDLLYSFYRFQEKKAREGLNKRI